MYGKRGAVRARLLLIRDITTRRRAEAALAESEASYRGIFDSVAEAIYVHDKESRILDIILGAVKMYGYPREFFIGKTPLILAAEEKNDLDRVKNYIDKAFHGQPQRFEFWGKRSNGEVFPKEVRLYPGTYFGQEVIIALAQDITDRKKAEEELLEAKRRLADIIDFLPDATLVIDKEGKIIAWSRAMEAMTGMKSEDILGKGNYEYALPLYGERRPTLLETIIGLQENYDERYINVEKRDGILIGEAYAPCLHGGAYIWAVATALYNSKGEIVGAIESIRDITDRKASEEALIASLQEKDVLLKEIHHRVKNNLQIIQSLLSIQSGYVQDEGAKEVMMECKNRIRSMALVHENLYRSENLAAVSFAEYIRSLAKFLQSSFGPEKRHIKLRLDLEEVFLDIDSAISCGLVLNELVSNSLKHAFPGLNEGEVLIKLSAQGGKVLLMVKDDGVGLPGELNLQESETMGLKLVNALVKQLKGSIEVDRSPGTEFRILINKPSLD